MPLNPDKNLYSVAPIGHIVVIGRQTALKGGLTREQAINLLSGLILATAATPDEIGASIMDLCTTGTPVKQAATPRLTVMPQVAPLPPPPEAFIGAIDAEEQAAIDAATKPQPVATQPPQMPTLPTNAPIVGRAVMRPASPQAPKSQVRTVDVDATALAWQGKGASNA